MANELLVVPARRHASLYLTTYSGRVTVLAEEREDVVFESGVESASDVKQDASGRIVVTSAKGGMASLRVRCPAGIDIVVGTSAGRVELRGRLGDVRVTTSSGRIEVDEAQTLDLRSVSGSIVVTQCGGRCRLHTKSGKATIGLAEDAEVSTVSGQVRLASCCGRIQVRTASGSVEVGAEGGGDLAIDTLSGPVMVGVPKGVRPATNLRSTKGRIQCDCPTGRDCRITVSSVSGEVQVVPS